MHLGAADSGRERTTIGKLHMRVLSAPLVASCLVAALLDGAPALARSDQGRETAAPSVTDEAPDAIRQYCTNIRDAAADTRIAWQTEALRKLEQEIEDRIAELNRQQSEFEQWLQRREAFLARTRENLVAVYASMRPDAAATQLSILDAETSASILANLQPRVASAILNEMEPQRAAELVVAMAGPSEKSELAASR